MSDVTQILNAVERGDARAADELLTAVYDELRRLAAWRLSRELPGQTLQGTALVHEAYLRLVGGPAQNWANRRHFFAAAAEAMRRILVENARRKKNIKAGGNRKRVHLHDETELKFEGPCDDLISLDVALSKLADKDKAKYEIVKLRYFAGLTLEQGSGAMGNERPDPEEIFDVASEKADPAERAAYLDEVCGEDRQLRAEVEELLKAHEEAGGFLEAPAYNPDLPRDEPSAVEGPGTMVGRYKLLKLIGEGGMGLVYLAEQQEPLPRRVALKIVKIGMDTKQVITRFEVERQTLALLDHPNIANVYDAGATKTGRPYFVMEYIQGLSITEHCDAYKLSVEERLKLFVQVCEAIHYAHQKGIIHRDIKPSNILVSVEGDKAMPKMIDFGIAKALAQRPTERTFFTEQGQLLGTPEYMSPEQVEMANQDIDTRSDVYSLGVLLYELLTGTLPFDRKMLQEAGFAEIQRIIRQQEPPRPSVRLTSLGEEAEKVAESRRTEARTLAKRLAKELEWIPLRAMRKEPQRRYRSVSELADDIQNYLSGNPLIAGPESRVYRVKKFVRKHTAAVVTVVIVAAVVVVGLIVSTVMYLRAEQAQRTANEQAEAYRKELYANRIRTAEIMYRDSDIPRMVEILISCPADLRGWEWYRLWRISHKARLALHGHTDWVMSATFDPEGNRIVSGSKDKTIKVWSAETGAEIMTIRRHDAAIFSAEFSPDGKRIVSGAWDAPIKVWDAATGAELMSLAGHEDCVRSVAFSPDSERIVSAGDDRTVRVWNTSTGAELTILRGHDDWVLSVAFSPDARRIAVGGRTTIEIWDSASREEVAAELAAGGLH